MDCTGQTTHSQSVQSSTHYQQTVCPGWPTSTHLYLHSHPCSHTIHHHVWLLHVEADTGHNAQTPISTLYATQASTGTVIPISVHTGHTSGVRYSPSAHPTPGPTTVLLPQTTIHRLTPSASVQRLCYIPEIAISSSVLIFQTRCRLCSISLYGD